MQLHQLLSVMEDIAPARYAEPWDNVGLLAGDPNEPVTKVLLTIDYTSEVAAEGQRLGCDAVIAYHPPLFHPVKRLTAGNPVFDAIRRGVAIYSPHTALDVAAGGTNDVLCDVLGLSGRSALKISETKTNYCKLVTFAPAEAVEKICQRMFAEGAGKIGKYTSCSFRSEGTGTFFGEPGTHPAVGESGKLERTPEVRIESIVELSRVSDVVRALREAHPYEEPAFDLVSLAATPTGLGIGRVGDLTVPVDRADLLARLKNGLNVQHLLIAGPLTGVVTRLAVCAGACGNLINDAIEKKVELYVTGEMRHHDALKAAEAGLTVVCTLHSNSERVTLSRLKSRLHSALPELSFDLSQADRDPFVIR